MRIHSVRINGFKGLDVELPWASAIVLFGANDSGKSNILEGFASRLASDHDVRGGGPRAGVELRIELDGLAIPGSADQKTFLALVCGERLMPAWHKELDGADEAPQDALGELEGEWTGWLGLYVMKRWMSTADGMDQLVKAVQDIARRELEFFLRIRGHEDRLAETTTPALSQHFTVSQDDVCWHQCGESATWHGTSLRLVGHDVESHLLDALRLRVIRVSPGPEVASSLYDRLDQCLRRTAGYLFAEADGAAADGAATDGADDLFFDERLAPESNPWTIRREGGIFVRPSVLQACKAIGERVDELAPPFVASLYEIKVAPFAPESWLVEGGRHAGVWLRPRSKEASFPLEVTSSGVATWAKFALSEALREIEEAFAHAEESAQTRREDAETTVYVFDEPEAHLHPTAQEEAARWIAERARSGVHVLLASHAVPFLDLPLEDAAYLKVVRTADWVTTLEPMGEDVLGAVAASAEGLGQPPVALIQLTRAWLVVEGEHDRRIVEHFYGRDLRAARISVLPLRGAARAKASFLNLGALAPLGIPFFCLLDNAMVEAVRAGRTERPDMTEEERIAEQLILLAMRDGLQLDVLGLPFPDIICALPMGAVRAVVVEHDGKMEAATSWEDLLERHRRACDAARGRGVRPPGFKSFILEDVGLRGWSPDRLIDEVLAVSSGMLPASALSQRMMEIIAAVSSESPARSR